MKVWDHPQNQEAAVFLGPQQLTSQMLKTLHSAAARGKIQIKKRSEKLHWEHSVLEVAMIVVHQSALRNEDQEPLACPQDFSSKP